MKRRPIILLELMIAIALLALFAAPLLRTPMQLAKQEVASLEAIEYERLANSLLIDLKADIYAGKPLPTNGLDKTKTLSPISFEVLPGKLRYIKPRIKIGKIRQGDLLTIKVSFPPYKKWYTQTLYVQKESLSKKDS